MLQVTPGLPHVHLWDFSRLSFVNTVLSKRKLTWFVDNGKVSAWSASAIALTIALSHDHERNRAAAMCRCEPGASTRVWVTIHVLRTWATA